MLRLRRITEWAVIYPADHILRKLGGGSPTTNEQSVRDTFDGWRRVGLVHRRVWRLEWGWHVDAVKDWDERRGGWIPRTTLYENAKREQQ